MLRMQVTPGAKVCQVRYDRHGIAELSPRMTATAKDQEAKIHCDCKSPCFALILICPLKIWERSLRWT